VSEKVIMIAGKWKCKLRFS